MMRPRKGVERTCIMLLTNWTGKVSTGDPCGTRCDMGNDILRVSRGNQASGNMAGSIGLLPFRTLSSGRHRYCHAVPLLVRLHLCRNVGVVLAHAPTTPECTVVPFLFRVFLMERSHSPLPVTESSCSCGAPLDSYAGHSGALLSGLLKKRVTQIERMVARIFRVASSAA